MPRCSKTPLEELVSRLKGDRGLDGHEELRKLLLTRTRALQRRGLTEDEMDVAMVSVLFRRDVLLQAAVTTAEAMNLRVRQAEQIHKARNALLRRGRAVPGWKALPRREVPKAWQPYRSDDADGEVEKDGNGND